MQPQNHEAPNPGLTRRIFRRFKAFGEPLWFVLSVVLPLLVKTRRRPVLFSRPAALGDIICTFPAALELKKRHVGATFLFHCREEYACLPPMGGVTPHVVDHLNIEALETTYAFLFAGIYKFTYADENGERGSTESVIAELCRKNNVPVTEDHPQLEPGPAAVAAIKALLRTLHLADGPYAVIHPGPSWPVREWPMKEWAKLTEDLSQNGCKNIIQIGSSHTGETKPLPGVVLLADQLLLEECVALISMCRLFIGIESGLLHIAAAVRVPAVGLFGPTSPQLRFAASSTVTAVTAPVDCQGCHHRAPRLHWMTGCPYNIACMNAMPPDRIAEACRSRLEPTGRIAVQPAVGHHSQIS